MTEALERYARSVYATEGDRERLLFTYDRTSVRRYEREKTDGTMLRYMKAVAPLYPMGRWPELTEREGRKRMPSVGDLRVATDLLRLRYGSEAKRITDAYGRWKQQRIDYMFEPIREKIAEEERISKETLLREEQQQQQHAWQSPPPLIEDMWGPEEEQDPDVEPDDTPPRANQYDEDNEAEWDLHCYETDEETKHELERKLWDMDAELTRTLFSPTLPNVIDVDAEEDEDCIQLAQHPISTSTLLQKRTEARMRKSADSESNNENAKSSNQSGCAASRYVTTSNERECENERAWGEWLEAYEQVRRARRALATARQREYRASQRLDRCQQRREDYSSQYARRIEWQTAKKAELLRERLSVASRIEADDEEAETKVEAKAEVKPIVDTGTKRGIEADTKKTNSKSSSGRKRKLNAYERIIEKKRDGKKGVQYV